MPATPTIGDVEALWGPATPQFAFQIADRMAALVAGLDPADPVRVRAEQRVLELEQLGLGASKGESTAH